MTQWTREDLYGQNTIREYRYCKNCRHCFQTDADFPFFTMCFCTRKASEVLPMSNCSQFIRRGE